jgi:hypothetical protein
MRTTNKICNKQKERKKRDATARIASVSRNTVIAFDWETLVLKAACARHALIIKKNNLLLFSKRKL